MHLRPVDRCFFVVIHSVVAGWIDPERVAADVES